MTELLPALKVYELIDLIHNHGVTLDTVVALKQKNMTRAQGQAFLKTLKKRGADQVSWPLNIAALAASVQTSNVQCATFATQLRMPVAFDANTAVNCRWSPAAVLLQHQLVEAMCLPLPLLAHQAPRRPGKVLLLLPAEAKRYMPQLWYSRIHLTCLLQRPQC